MALRCDLIIRDATVFDGTGAPRFRADIGVNGDRIAAVGNLGGASADREVLAAGKAVGPGFIDAHTHDDRAVLCGYIGAGGDLHVNPDDDVQLQSGDRVVALANTGGCLWVGGAHSTQAWEGVGCNLCAEGCNCTSSCQWH